MNRFLSIQSDLEMYKKSVQLSNTKSRRLSFQKNPVAVAGAVIAGVGVGWKVLTYVLDRTEGDISISLARMEGYKFPNDNRERYTNNAALRNNRFTVKRKNENHVRDEISATFEIRFKYNGHAVGEISIEDINRNDAIGWGLEVRTSMMPDNTLYGPNQDIAAVELTFNYRFHRTLGSDIIKMARYRLYGDGRAVAI